MEALPGGKLARAAVAGVVVVSAKDRAAFGLACGANSAVPIHARQVDLFGAARLHRRACAEEIGVPDCPGTPEKLLPEFYGKAGAIFCATQRHHEAILFAPIVSVIGFLGTGPNIVSEKLAGRLGAPMLQQPLIRPRDIIRALPLEILS
jgi:hypothetical protein